MSRRTSEFHTTDENLPQFEEQGHVHGATRIEAARRTLAGSRWRLILDGRMAGQRNMQIDEAILSSVASGSAPPTLRLYGWSPPAVSLGRFQTSYKGIELSACRRQGWDVVRRPTGGRAVLHAEELTYSLAVPLSLIGGVGVRRSHCLFTNALHVALRAIVPGLALTQGCASDRGKGGASCFALAGAADSVVAGRKLVGSAQVRRAGALLQHGSILLHVDREALAELFEAPGDPIGLDELVPELPPWEELQPLLARALGQALGICLTLGAGSEAELGRYDQ